MERFPLHIAAENFDVEELVYLINQGVPIDARNDKDQTPLHLAVDASNLEVVRYLIHYYVADGSSNMCCDLDPMDINGVTPLQVAASKKDKDIVKLLLESGANGALCNSNGWNVLHFAARESWLDIAELVLEKKVDIDAKTCEGHTALALSVIEGHSVGMIKLLSMSGADVNCFIDGGLTVLHYACKNGLFNVVLNLINNPKLNLGLKTPSGKTAMMLSLEGGHKKVTELLTPKHIAFVNTERLLLHLAAKNCDIEEIICLIDQGVSIDALNDEGQTPLHVAVTANHLEVVRYLIQYYVADGSTNMRCDLDLKDSHGVTPLLAATLKKNKDIVKLLLESGASGVMYNCNGWNALHYAAQENWLDVAKHILEGKVDSNVKTSEGQTALALAVREGHGDMVKLLLMSGADVNCCIEEGLTVLQYACKKGLFNVVLNLINNPKLNVGLKTPSGKTAMMLSLEEGHTSVVELLTPKHIALVNMERHLLHLAAKNCDIEEMVCLIDQGVPVDARNDKGQTPLHLAADANQLEVVQYLLQYYNSDGCPDLCCDLDPEDINGVTPLLAAACKRHKNIALLLLESGANGTICNADGWNILHFAAEENWLDVAYLVLEKKVNVDAKTTEGKTALMLAMDKGHRIIVEWILRVASCADWHCKNNDWNLLHYASANGWWKVVQLITKRRLLDVDLKSNSGDLAIVLAVKKGHEKVVELLLNAFADYFCFDDEASNLLHHASARGWFKVAEYIVDEQLTDIDARQQFGRRQTPLLLAACNGMLDVTELLIIAEANVTLKDTLNYTALHYAVMQDWSDIVELVIQEDARTVHEKNCDGQTPLYAACDMGKGLDTIRPLLRAGADVNSRNKWHDSIFYSVSETCYDDEDNYYEDLIKTLINHGAFYDSGIYSNIYEKPLLRESILKNWELSTRAILNKFNNYWLPKIYEMPEAVTMLPPLQHLQIHHSQDVAHQIAEYVKQILSKQFYDVSEMRPPVLKFLCARALVGYVSSSNRKTLDIVEAPPKKPRIE